MIFKEYNYIMVKDKKSGKMIPDPMRIILKSHFIYYLYSFLVLYYGENL